LKSSKSGILVVLATVVIAATGVFAQSQDAPEAADATPGFGLVGFAAMGDGTTGGAAGEPQKPSKKEGAVNLTYTMYLNGEVVASEIYPVPPFLPNLAYSIGGKPNGEYAIAGDIDELMVFNRQLTAKDVAGLYTANALPNKENN
jgi:hypothetical protein